MSLAHGDAQTPLFGKERDDDWQEKVDTKIAIQQILMKLDPVSREMIILKYMEEYTEDEISEEMNIPVPKIQEKLPGILKLLAKLYTD